MPSDRAWGRRAEGKSLVSDCKLYLLSIPTQYRRWQQMFSRIILVIPCEAPMRLSIQCFRSGDVLATPGGLTMIALSIFLALSSLMVEAAEPQDRKSFKTIPFDPTPSETQRRELERMIDLCIKTVDREVPGGHFSASVDGGIVNTLGIDRERFKFWKCMSQNGHPLAPIDKSRD